MNTDNYHFVVNKTHRENVMRQANHQRLSRQVTRRTVPRTIHVGLLTLWQFLFR